MSTVDNLISEVKLQGGFPDDNYFSDAEMLTILNNALKTVVTPFMMKIKEDYFLKSVTHSITSGSSYRFPARNIGGKLRDVKVINGDNYVNLNRLFEEDRQSNPSGYYIFRNSITLSDDIESGTLELVYFLKPSRLILEASAAKILSIDSSTQVTVTALPSTITTSTPVDLIQHDLPRDVLAIDQTITNISGTTLTFASLPTGLQVDDYVCLADESPVLLMPVEMEPLLVKAALVQCLNSKKDSAAKYAKEELEDIKRDLLEMMDPRVESNDIVFNGQGLLSYIRQR